MSYAPYQRNTSGIVFFGEQGNQPTFYSDSNFLVEDGAAGHIQAPNLIISDGGNIGSVSDPDSIQIASNGDISMSQSLSITGDLTVNGTTTTVNSTVVTIEDPVVIIGAEAGDNPYGSTADDNKDRGIAFYWNEAGPKIGFFGHDDSIRGFTYIPSGTFDAASGVITGPVGWARFAGVSGDIVGSVTGDLTGNADTATALETARTITIGDQMSGNTSFDGTANVTINVTANDDLILDQTAEATPDNDDLILIYDDSAGALRKQTRAQFVSGLGAGSMDSWNVSADTGTTQTINDGNTMALTGGSGIATRASATDTVTINVKVDDSTISIVSDELEVADNGITATQINTSVAGNGLTGGGGTALAVGAGSLIDVTATTVDVDLTEAAAATIADNDYLIFLDGGSTGAESKGSTRDFATLLAGNGLSSTNSTLAVDLSEFSDGVVNSGDKFAVLHNNGTSEELISISQLGSWLAGTNISVSGDGRLNVTGGFSNFIMSDGSTTQTVDDGETMLFSDSTRVNFTVSATNTVTADLIANTVSETYLTTSVAGNGLSGGNGSALAVGAGTLVDVTATVVNVDLSEATESAIAAADYILFLDGGATGTAAKESLADFSTFLAGDGLSQASSALAVNVDDTTIEINADTLRVKAGGIGENEIGRTVATISSNVTISSDVNLVNAAGAARTVTMPDVTDTGKLVRIKKTDSSANTVTIQRGGSSTIDGATTKILYSQYESMTLVSDGTNWHIV